MKWARILILAVSTVLVAGVSLALRAGRLPAGVRGEWEWPRVAYAPIAWDVALAVLAIAAYAAYAGAVMHALRVRPARGKQAAWLAGLIVFSIAAQVGVTGGAPTGYGLTRWVALAMPGSSGYFEVARTQMADPRGFWSAYPAWIRDQDALHIGTHPPGLFLVSRGLMGLTANHPQLVRWVELATPKSVSDGFVTLVKPMPRHERSAIVLMAALTMAACCATVVPIYALARSRLSASASWASATLWPLAPAAVMFSPAADTAFPLLSTSAIALAARGGWRCAVMAGVILGVGMQFTLAFLPAGLVVGIILGMRAGTARDRAARILLTGAGFLAITGVAWAASGGANPFAIWWANAANHARFYEEYPRSYRAWIVVNGIEAAIAVSLASVVWMALGVRRAPRAAWAVVAVLLILNFSGKNLSEVARLWLPFYPSLLAMAGSGMERWGAGAMSLGATVALIGLQTLALGATIQVVYPF